MASRVTSMPYFFEKPRNVASWYINHPVLLSPLESMIEMSLKPLSQYANFPNHASLVMARALMGSIAPQRDIEVTAM